MTVPATDVATAFNQNNDRKTWKATCTGELVHFSALNGMVSLVYDAQTGEFSVKFNKFQGAFGDYIKAISRGLFSVLNSLKSAGLPFEGPASVDDMRTILRVDPDGNVTCEWEGMTRVWGVPMHMQPDAEALPPVL